MLYTAGVLFRRFQRFRGATDSKHRLFMTDNARIPDVHLCVEHASRSDTHLPEINNANTGGARSLREKRRTHDISISAETNRVT